MEHTTEAALPSQRATPKPVYNPLTLRLARKDAEAVVLRVVCLSAGAGLALGAGGIWVLPHVRRLGDGIAVAIVLLSIALHMLTPFAVSVVAIMLTARDVQQGDYELIRLSMLPEDCIVSGYFVAALYRLRYLLALMAVSSAVMLVLMQFLAFFSLPFVISAWGFVRLAAAVGVNVALRNDRAWMGWTPPVTLFAGVFFVLAALFFSTVTFGCGPYSMILVPFALAEAAKDNARRWVRPRSS